MEVSLRSHEAEMVGLLRLAIRVADDVLPSSQSVSPQGQGVSHSRHGLMQENYHTATVYWKDDC